MQYVGGKQKSGGAQIAKAINAAIVRSGATTYSEPFCGGLSVLSRIVAPVRMASDACEALIALYRALQNGWQPPAEMTREEWTRLRDANDATDPLTAFAGFGCSNRAAWFGTYLKQSKRTDDHYVPAALAAAESLVRKMSKCADVEFAARTYDHAPLGDVVYCDPPYDGTLGYPAVGPWDAPAFWQWVRSQAVSRLICVSERAAPADFQPLLTFSIQSRIAVQTGARRTEHLFVHESQLQRWCELTAQA